MAKALFGHVGTAPDQRLRDEIRRLRDQVQGLEFDLARVRAENDRLLAEAGSSQHALTELSTLEEPALT